MTRLRIATRGSALARWQADHVAALLHKFDPGVEADVVVVETSGDRRLDVPIWELGGKGVFVKEVQAAVLDGRADVAVHSAKDLPSATPDGLVIAAVPERADVRDALVGARLADLAAGARRRHRIAAAPGPARRTPVPTCTSRACGATWRPGWPEPGSTASTRSWWPPPRSTGSPGATASPSGCRSRSCSRRWARRRWRSSAGPTTPPCAPLLAAIEHRPSRQAVDAERGFLAELGGDCSLPAAAYAVTSDDPDGGAAPSPCRGWWRPSTAPRSSATRSPGPRATARRWPRRGPPPARRPGRRRPARPR